MKNLVVVDINGTLSDASERAAKYLSKEPKDWDGFYAACGEDKPKQEILDLVGSLLGKYEIVLCTGRRESTNAATRKWLGDNMPIHSRVYGVPVHYRNDRETHRAAVLLPILYRRDGDTRHDTIVKPELLDEYLRQHPDYKVAFILEDRNSMVAKWRELGYTCLQVAEGDF